MYLLYLRGNSMETYFYTQKERTEKNAEILDAIEIFANDNCIQTYAILEPLGEGKYNYVYDDAISVLIPGYKIIIINLGENGNEEFEYYCDDLVEDLSHISDKYTYKEKIGRPRDWKRNQIEIIDIEDFSVSEFIEGLNSFKLEKAIHAFI